MPVHRWFKEANRSALFCLRTIKCGFCIRDQGIYVRTVLRKNADTDGEASVDIVVVYANGRDNDRRLSAATLVCRGRIYPT